MSDPRQGLKTAIKDSLQKVTNSQPELAPRGAPCVTSTDRAEAANERLATTVHGNSLAQVFTGTTIVCVRAAVAVPRLQGLAFSLEHEVLEFSDVIAQVYELQATVGDFSGDEALLTGRIDALLASLGELHDCRNEAAFDVPVDLVRQAM